MRPRRPLAGPGVVDQPDPHAGGLDDLALRQQPAKLGRVDVPVHRGKGRPESAQILQHGGRGKVARVQDESPPIA